MIDPPDPVAPANGALNANHKRRIEATFTYVDGLLQTVERLAQARSTPFSREQADVTETEAQLLLSQVAAARQRMLETLDHLAIPRPRPIQSARWGIATSLRFIDIALSELTGRELAGYGAVDRDMATNVTAVAGELRTVIERARQVLQPEEGEHLRERVAGIAGPMGDVLRQAEQVSREFALVDARHLIAVAADRATTNTIDVGVFGRVSSGKSSLINALIGAPILPVGSTPVTAVPLRVTHGEAGILVSLADGRSERIEQNQLPDFATEAGNRDNHRAVSSILIHTPLLPAGLALVDTPGVGSLSQSGPAQAFAQLPRCDLGVVLVSAGTPLGRDELALVSGLTRAGIAVEVLVSKIDLLPAAERSAALQYVQAELERGTGVTGVAVRGVSILEGERALLAQWRDGTLARLIGTRAAAADAARARRMRAILSALDAGLRGHTRLEPGSLDLQRARLEAEASVRSIVDELETAARPTLVKAAEAAATAWKTRANAQLAVEGALTEPPERALIQLRLAADRVLGDSPDTNDDVADRLPPLFDPGFLERLTIPATATGLDRLFPRGRATSRLAPLHRALDAAYTTYAQRLRAWALERVDENFERAQSARQSGHTAAHPELTELSALIDRHFPSPS